MRSWRAAQNKKKSVPSWHEFSSLFSCVRGHVRSLSHLVNRVQTSNKAHDKFVPRRDCACADHSRPSLSTGLVERWSSHLVLIGFRLTAPLSQAPLLGQDELTRRKRNLDTRGLSVRLHTLSKSGSSSHSPYRKQGLPRRDELAFGRPKLAYGLMTARFHTLFWTVPIAKLVDSKEKIDRI